MPDYLAPLRLTPTSSILASSFICIDSVQGDYLCRQATAQGDAIIAVSQVAYDLPPNLIAALTGGTATFAQVAALAGEPLQLFHSGDIAPLVLGTGGATPGAFMTNDVHGNGIITAKGSGVPYGGIALEAGNAGEVIEIWTHFGTA